MIVQIQRALLQLLTVLQLCSAWHYEGGWGFGAGPMALTQHHQLFVDANRHPNITKVIPHVWFNGDQYFKFRINITEVTPTGVDTKVRNPRVINTVYSLEWKGGESINETIQYKDNPARLCAHYPLGLWPASVTNNFDASVSGGNCNSVFGDDCYDDLIAMSYGWTASCLNGWFLPHSCENKFPGGGIGSAALTDPSPAYADKNNLTASQRMHDSPYGFAFWASPIYEAGDMMAYTRETERLHVMILNAKGTVPICARVTDDHVSPGGPSSGAEGKWKGSAALALLMACTIALWLF